MEMLEARRYANTSLQLKIAGQWQPVSFGTLTMRELQWPSLQVPFRGVEQCGVLGWPLDWDSPR
jgi:hypothetical protein